MEKGYVRRDGYRQVWTKREGVWERDLAHRVVMEKIMGRRLRRDEQVHHRDGNKLNNTPDNLTLTDTTHRTRYHTRLFRDTTHKECSRCSERKPRTEFPPASNGRDPHHTRCKRCAALEARARRLTTGKTLRRNAWRY